MQTFIDTATQQNWAFDDDVHVLEVGGVFSFKDRFGNVLAVPSTLQPHTPPAAPASN